MVLSGVAKSYPFGTLERFAMPRIDTDHASSGRRSFARRCTPTIYTSAAKSLGSVSLPVAFKVATSDRRLVEGNPNGCMDMACTQALHSNKHFDTRG